MFDALTSARLELSSTAIKNLTELNSRLRDLVPETRHHPAAAASSSRYHHHHHHSGGDSDSSSSSTSDPSEMFHVDAMTQTSPPPSLDFGPDEEYMTPDSKLEHLSTQLHALVTSHSDGTDKDLTVALKDLRVYLEGMVLEYDWPGSSTHLLPHDWMATAATKEKDKDDPVAKLKAEIRSVKGVMLNTYVASLLHSHLTVGWPANVGRAPFVGKTFLRRGRAMVRLVYGRFISIFYIGFFLL